jgi:hypothetical protein
MKDNTQLLVKVDMIIHLDYGILLLILSSCLNNESVIKTIKIEWEEMLENTKNEYKKNYKY